MKKLLFSALAAMTVSFSATAQTAGLQRVDLRDYNVMPRTTDVPAPQIKTANDVVSEKTNYCLFDAKDDYANAYGFVIFDWRYKTNAVINFSTDAVTNYTMQANYGQIPMDSYGFYCSTFVGDKIFAYCYRYYGQGAMVPSSFGFIDPHTGLYEKKYDVAYGESTILSDMSYDPETKLVYAVQLNYEDQRCVGSTLYSIDPTSDHPNFNVIAKLSDEIYTLSCDRGNIYAVASVLMLDGVTAKSSKLLKMPISSIKNGNIDVEVIGSKDGSLKVPVGYSQTMEFDKINHKLMWFAQTKDDASFLCTINTEKGIIENRQDLSSTCQVVAMAIPYQYAAKEAPSYVRNLKGEAAAEGNAKVTLSWTNPDKNYDLGELKSLTKIKIIRDDEIIATIDAEGIGQEQTYEDNNVESGIHIYKVLTVNEEGDGVYKEVRLFVGKDTPAGPSGIKIDVDPSNSCHATISWSAPFAGVNGGWIEKSSLKYDVVRYPGGVKIASDIAECTVEDNVEETEGYYYEITSKNENGVGGKTVSDVVVFGPKQTVPFFSKLNTIEDFNKWIVLDNNNDLTTWKFSRMSNVTCYDRGEGPADDYLVSPAIMFEEGKKYQVRFKYWTINWVDPADQSPILDKMDVYYGSEPTAKEFKKEGSIIDLGEFHTASETYLYAKQVFTAKPGEGHIAFHAYSDANRSIIYVQDVCVREYSATDLSITDFKGSISVVQGAKSVFAAEIMNEGSARVENYTVDLINADTGEVLASANGNAVDPENKTMVSIEWTPATTGKIHLTVRVNLEGDTYTRDNTWEEFMNVTVNPAGSDTWLSVNKDDSYDLDGDHYMKGSAVPFDFKQGYGMTQCIYLDKELTKKNISITGVKFIYDGMVNEEFSKDVKISAMGTDMDFFDSDENYNVLAFDVEDPEWLNLYEGKVTFGGMEKNSEMEIKFSNPYYYEKGNLVFMYEKLWEDMFFVKGEEPLFHYHDMGKDGENESKRTCLYRSKYSETVDNTKIGTKYFIPFTMFSYKEGDINGIFGVSQSGLNFDLSNGTLEMSEVCENIVVYSIDGKVVAEAHNASILSLGSLHGVYVIKANAGSKTINTKVNF